MRWVNTILNAALTILILVYFFQLHSKSGLPNGPRVPAGAKNDLFRYDPNSHLETRPTSTPTETATAIPTGVYVMRINADGVSMVSADGRLWAQDKPYSENSYGYVGSTLIVTGTCSPQGVDPADYPLYNPIRYGMFMDYKFDLPQADTYHVTLYFDECHHNPGESRLFKILMQGSEVDQFDLVPLCVSSDGSRSLLTKSYDVAITPSNLTLDIGFHGVNDNAVVSAIQVTGTQPVKIP